MGSLRIAFFVTYFPKLSEVFILNQARALQARGHEVTFFALSNPNEDVVQPGAQEFIDDGRVRWVGMPAPFGARIAGVGSHLARLGVGRSLAALNPVAHGPEGFILTNVYRLSAMRGTPFDFDVVHAQFGSIGKQCVFLREQGVLGDAPLVTAFRGHDLSGYLRYGTRRVYERVFRESGAVMPVATRWADTLVGLGCPREKIHPLPSGVPMERVPRLNEWRRSDPFPRVVSGGRLDRYKGMHLGIEAFERIKREYPTAEYDIYGDGQERAALAAQAKAAGLADSVHLHGQVSHDALLRGLERSHLHLFTTVTLARGRTEGVPNILKEAQAVGLPSVGFDHPGVSEVIADGETGSIVPEGDVDAMTERALAVLADDALAQAMSRAAQERSRELFDLGKLTDKLEAIYEGVL